MPLKNFVKVMLCQNKAVRQIFCFSSDLPVYRNSV